MNAEWALSPEEIEAIAERLAEKLRPLLSNRKSDPQEDQVFDVKGLAAYICVKVSYVYKAVSEGTVPFFKVGKFPRFRKSEIDRWLAGKAVRPVPSLKLVKKQAETTGLPIRTASQN